MNLFFRVAKNDLKLIFRDKSLYIIFIVPFLMVLICRFGVSYLAGIISEIPDYYWLIVATFTSVVAATPSFLMSFILLDERDEYIHTMLKILPLPTNFILKSRIYFLIFFLITERINCFKHNLFIFNFSPIFINPANFNPFNRFVFKK